jgi:hypothetical protein
VEGAKLLRFGLADHHTIRFDLDVEKQAARVFYEFEKIAAHEDFAAAEGEKENSGLGKLIEHAFDFGGGHLAMVVVIQIAMHAALVASEGNIHVDGERHAKVECLLPYFSHEAHRETSCEPASG